MKQKDFNYKVLADNNLALKLDGSVDIKTQMKSKYGEIAQEFLITAVSCLPCLLVLDFMIDQENVINIGEQLLYSTKHQTALPISAQENDRCPNLCNSREECKHPHQT